MDDIVKTVDLRFAYVTEEGDYNFALNDLNTTIKEGDFTVILGKNGSGKSTFARLINVLSTPTSGKIFVAGMDTAEESKTLDIRKTAGMVFQNPDNQIVATVVEEDVAFGPENLGLPREEIRARIDSALEMVDMAEFRLHAPHMLSGGQKQRIAIAGVLAMKPRLIVLDEATAMLDPQGRKDILAIIRKLNKEEHITIVLITHNMDEAIDADKVLVMKDGYIAKEGAPADIFFDAALLKEAGLLPPFAVSLSQDLRAAGIPVENTLYAEQLAEDLCRSK